MLFDGTRTGGEQEDAGPGPGTRANRCRLEEIHESKSNERRTNFRSCRGRQRGTQTSVTGLEVIGLSSTSRGRCLHKHGGDLLSVFCIELLVPDLRSSWKTDAVYGRTISHNVAYAGSGRCLVRVWRERVPLRDHVLVHCCVCIGRFPRRKCTSMGWFRAVTGVLQGRKIPTLSRVVRALGNRNNRKPNRSYEDFRGAARSYYVCR